MYYHVLIETSDNKIHELDKTNLDEIESNIIEPFINERQFQCDGYIIKPNNIKRIKILQSKETTSYYADLENDNMPENVLMYISRQDILDFDRYVTDITNDVMEKARNKYAMVRFGGEAMDNKKIFVVHGHDEEAKITIARFIENLGCESIILHEKASSGKTIIEKIESYSSVGFAVVLLTPDDMGAQKDGINNLSPRARQNVIFEHGYLIGKLGRQRVCALVKGDIEIPTDMSGIIYVKLDKNGAWEITLAQEMKEAGLEIDMNKIRN